LAANPLRAAWASGRATSNGWLTLPHIMVAEAMAAQPWDSITIDMHHGFVEQSDLIALLSAIGATGKPALVRVPWNDPGAIYKVLDAGAQGVICPMINSAAEALAFVNAVKYPPVGNRSFGPIRPLIKEGLSYVAEANEACLAFAQIETRQALDNLDTILATPGLDGLYVGPSDLAFDLGFGPHFDTEKAELLNVYRDLIARTRKHDRIACMHNTTPAYARKMAEMGFQLVTFGSNIGFVLAGGAGALAAFGAGGAAQKPSGY
jgi:4-hydroxy-2-oxoheptanedioate aldolase